MSTSNNQPGRRIGTLGPAVEYHNDGTYKLESIRVFQNSDDKQTTSSELTEARARYGPSVKLVMVLCRASRLDTGQAFRIWETWEPAPEEEQEQAQKEGFVKGERSVASE